MRIMITDDEPRRYGRLIEALAHFGINRDCIEFSSCATEARTRLQSSHYDLLILDILLPLWPDGDPDAQFALDLLFELHESEDLHKPTHIIGITADSTVAEETSAIFTDRTWTVAEYSASNDGWVDKIVNCIVYMIEGKKASVNIPDYSVDLAIICALEKPELQEVLKLPWNWSSPRPLNDLIFVQDGYFNVGRQKLSVCATAAPRMGMVSTALHSAAIISLLRPRLIAMCGICAGVEGKVNIGDVLLADPAWDFQSGKRVRDKKNSKFSIAPHQISSPESVRTHVDQINRDNDALAQIANQYYDEAPNILRVHVGPVASGSAVLADGEVINEIKQQHRNLIGVEMEIYGMYAAAAVASKPQPQAFALKGVCDFAAPDKEDKYQRYAAYASANVLRLLMERFGSRLLA